MARKTKEIKIEKGRDAGKKFRLTEMSAVSLEKWVTKAICALLNSGVELPTGLSTEDLQGTNGMSILLSHGIRNLSKIKYEYVQPLYAELLSCVDYLGTEGGSSSISRTLTEDTSDEVIEDVKTLFLLRFEVLKLHFDFLETGGQTR